MKTHFALLASLFLASEAAAENPVVTFHTVLGDFAVELCEQPSTACLGAAPDTVANFLTNMAAGDYDAAVIHDHTETEEVSRLIGGFFQAPDTTIVTNAALTDAIPNEANQDNTRGTLAMDKPSGLSTSHATRWYLNLADNPLLDSISNGYTVFGVVLDMTVVDAIAALERCDVRTQTVLVSPASLKNLWGQMPHVGSLDPCNPPGGVAEPVTDPVEIPEELVIVSSITVPEAGGAGAALGVLLALAARRGR